MGEPVKFPKDATRSGVQIEFVKTKSRIDIFGWYDSFVGIEPSSVSLREFFDLLGITEKHCQKAFKGNSPEK